MRKNECGCGNCKHEVCCTKKVPLFSSLGTEDLNRIISMVTHKYYPEGEMVIMEGEPCQNLIIINRGSVKAYRYTPDGKEQILYVFSDGDFFGEMNILRQGKMPFNVETLENTYLCMINRKDFEQYLHQHSEISMKIIEELGSRLLKAEEMLRSMASNDIEARVDLMLSEFAEKYGENTPEGVLIELPLSREGMANYIGVARETVSRKLSALKEQGIIDIIGSKKILIKK